MASPLLLSPSASSLNTPSQSRKLPLNLIFFFFSVTSPVPLFAFLEYALTTTQTTFEKLPGSAIIQCYMKNSHQNDLGGFCWSSSYSCSRFGSCCIRRIARAIILFSLAMKSAFLFSYLENAESTLMLPPSPYHNPGDLAAVPIIAGPNGHKPKLVGLPKGTVNLASFNFTGPAGNEHIKQRAVETLRKCGLGSCGLPGFYGTLDIHMDLENDFLGIGILNHFLRITECGEGEEKEAGTANETEGIFQKDGGRADLPQLIELKYKYKYCLIFNETSNISNLLQLRCSQRTKLLLACHRGKKMGMGRDEIRKGACWNCGEMGHRGFKCKKPKGYLDAQKKGSGSGGCGNGDSNKKSTGSANAIFIYDSYFSPTSRNTFQLMGVDGTSEEEPIPTFAEIFPDPTLREEIYLEAQDTFFGFRTLTTARAHSNVGRPTVNDTDKANF
ncbi:hypothetical protein K443DRAFT_11830 [Laccaria amethystina LaAM-08-1]|uniref:CCHC-type domain-containing protein n=1 Tax=Laccaria amethystina LaAM-08-1 TaxID=1095629 RepID=A0A0C9XF48_9AGAR|nr:hypothetical protein K443DRAFT_11830 [Laccaria amethystina LaAM-08-1]